MLVGSTDLCNETATVRGHMAVIIPIVSSKVVQYLRQDSSIGVTFWSRGLDWDGKMCVGSVVDAFHVGELIKLSTQGRTHSHAA